MNLPLEEKVAQYERITPITNDEELIQAIEQILDAEESLPVEDRNYDLIDEAVEMLLSLKGVDMQALDDRAEAVTSQVLAQLEKEAPAKARSRIIKLRWLLPVAAILTLLLAGTAVAYSLGYDLVAMTKEVYASLVQQIWHSDGNKEIIVTGDYGEYKTYEQLKNSEEFSHLLWPETLPEHSEIESVLVRDYGDHVKITLLMTTDSLVEKIIIQSPNFFSVEGLEMVIIGSFELYKTQYDNIYQAEFEHEGSTYQIKAYSEEALEQMVLCLK